MMYRSLVESWLFVHVCARGRSPSQCRRWSSNQLPNWARSMIGRVPINGTIPVLIFRPQLSNHIFAGMYRSPSSSGFVRRAFKTSTDGARAASTSGVYGTSEGSERISSAVGTSCAWTHFPSYCAHTSFISISVSLNHRCGQDVCAVNRCVHAYD